MCAPVPNISLAPSATFTLGGSSCVNLCSPHFLVLPPPLALCTRTRRHPKLRKVGSDPQDEKFAARSFLTFGGPAVDESSRSSIRTVERDRTCAADHRARTG
jgi:hypothetical protein